MRLSIYSLLSSSKKSRFLVFLFHGGISAQCRLLINFWGCLTKSSSIVRCKNWSKSGNICSIGLNKNSCICLLAVATDFALTYYLLKRPWYLWCSSTCAWIASERLQGLFSQNCKEVVYPLCFRFFFRLQFEHRAWYVSEKLQFFLTSNRSVPYVIGFGELCGRWVFLKQILPMRVRDDQLGHLWTAHVFFCKICSSDTSMVTCDHHNCWITAPNGVVFLGIFSSCFQSTFELKVSFFNRSRFQDSLFCENFLKVSCLPKLLVLFDLEIFPDNLNFTNFHKLINCLLVELFTEFFLVPTVDVFF